MSGEEIIARFTEKQTPDGKSLYTLKDAHMVIMGRDGVMMIPWLPYTKAPDTGVDVPASYIGFMVEPSEGMKTTFDGTANSGLVTPSTGGGLKLSV